MSENNQEAREQETLKHAVLMQAVAGVGALWDCGRKFNHEGDEYRKTREGVRDDVRAYAYVCDISYERAASLVMETYYIMNDPSRL